MCPSFSCKPARCTRCSAPMARASPLSCTHCAGWKAAAPGACTCTAACCPTGTPSPSPATPRWLMLDEPTAALDLAHQHSVMRLMQQLAAQGHGVIAVLHDLNLAETYADQALVMRDGRLDTMGRCEEVLQPSLIQRIWGVVCERLPRPASCPGLGCDGLITI